jgi:hypothetical protein
MNGDVQFHQTRTGRTFFEHSVPELIKAMQDLATELRLWREALEERRKKQEPEP